MHTTINPKVIEKKIIFEDQPYMTWQFTNENNLQETAIMDPDGYDVSLMEEVLDGHIVEEAIIFSTDPQQYIHESFCSFKKGNHVNA